MAKNTDEKLNIQEAIKAFGSKNFSEAGINLFSTLGYDTSLQAPLDDKTYQEFKETYIEGSPNAERFNEEKALVENWKSIDILFQLTNESFNGTKSLFEPSVNPYEPQSYLCFAIELKGDEYSKTQIAGITREVNKLFSIPIIIIFKYGECITLAIINRRVNKRNSDRDVLEKVTLIKDIFFEKPHRAHIEILFDMSLPQLNSEYQINNFDSLHKAWSEVLDTQTLNKRFYTELSNWYFWAIKTVVYPGYEYEAERNSLFTKEEKLREHNAKNLIRLLTRLLFVWFIKEKDLIPDELFDEKSIKNLITSFEPEKFYRFEDIDVESKSIYYKAILQNLFFASLNAEHGKRAFRIDGQNQNATSLMRYQRYHKNPEAFVKLIESKVPFMNGGLFECLDHQDDELKGKKGGAVIDYEDGFSDRKDNELFVPDYVFFGKEIKVDLSSEYDDKKKRDVTVNGIINILQKYKFTIAENTPVEEDIALDPELLGRVFENLLASYNPETKTNARKQTGSFYTPRPIVEYMVDESLKAYLKTKIKDAALSKGTLEEKTAAIAELDKTIDSKLDILVSYNENELDFSEEERKEILRYIDECKILDPACGSGAFPMGILQKMVYVIHKLDPQNDNWKLLQIEKIMTASNISSKEKNDMIAEISSIFDDNDLDYARKLYLIENCIHGIDIQPIATQISRLRFFISLIVDQKVDSTKPNFGVRPLPNLENRFVTANSLIGLDEQQAYLSTDEMDNLLKQLQKVRHDLFKAKTPKHKFELRQQDKEIREKLEQELISVGFGKENARLLSTWDPYDKNRSAEFFDAEWMFGIKDGFDICIANPPYIRELGNEHVFAPVNNTYFGEKYHAGKMDYWFYFLHKAIELTHPNSVITFITSRYWLKSTGAKKLIKHIDEELSFIQLIDVGNLKVFDNVVGNHMIALYQKTKNKDCLYRLITEDISNIEIRKFEEERVINRKNLIPKSYDGINIETNSASKVLEKLESFRDSEKLFKATQGIVENPSCLNKKNIANISSKGINTDSFYDGQEVFVVSNKTLEKLKLNKAEMKLVVPYHEPNHIHRYYYDNKSDKYLLYITKESVKNIDDFPNIKNHLLQFKPFMEQRRETINGSNKWYHLHWPRTKEIFENEKIIYPQMVDKPYFSYVDTPYYVNMSTNIIISQSSIDMKCLVGILNSKLGVFYVSNKAKLRGVGFDISVAVLNDFPVNKIILQDCDISLLVNKIIAIKKEDSSANTSALEKQIDEKVYKLYDLTPEEIAIVEGR